MKLLITGASGFLGQYVVAEALRRGHHVRAMIRPAAEVSRLAWADHAEVEIVRADLRASPGLADAVRGVDAVIHLAAAKSGDFYTQFRGTVTATENLLAAMHETNVLRLIAISTFSVYDYLRLRCGKRLDENAPLDRHPERRDEYARTKLIQEQLVRDFAETQGGKITILRPGVIFGAHNTWTARLGAQLSERRWLRIGANARLPLCYVENCAEAILLAAERDEAIGRTINLVDDETPTQRQYMAELARRMESAPSIIPLNWTLMRLLARSATIFNALILRGRAKLPSILVPARLHARCKPLRYANARMKEVLGYEPHYTLAIALDRSFTQQEAKDRPQGTSKQRPSTPLDATTDKEKPDSCASPI